MKFDGFLTLYQEGTDDAADDEDAKRLPAMSAGEALQKRDIDAAQHFTEPPPRYSEASLVKRMEELGIGRPSTYASILQVLKDRGYVRIDKKRLMPEDKGRVLTAFLESFFARYVEYGFTADLEEQLDRISNNELAWRDLLRDFWRDFTAAVGEIKELRVAQVIDALDEMLGPHLFPPRADGTDPRQCPTCGRPAVAQARQVRRLHRLHQLSRMPLHPPAHRPAPTAPADGGTKQLGEDPETGLEVTLRTGRFGPYVQLGEAVEGEKPKRAGLPKGTAPDDVDLARALGLALAAARGRQASRRRRADPRRHRPLRPLRAARQDLRQSRSRRRRAHHRAQPRRDPDRREDRQGSGQEPLRRRPRAARSASIRTRADRSWSRTAATAPMSAMTASTPSLPSDKTPETITLEEAVSLIDARATDGRPPAQRRRPARGARQAPRHGPSRPRLPPRARPRSPAASPRRPQIEPGRAQSLIAPSASPQAQAIGRAEACAMKRLRPATESTEAGLAKRRSTRLI